MTVDRLWETHKQPIRARNQAVLKIWSPVNHLIFSKWSWLDRHKPTERWIWYLFPSSWFQCSHCVCTGCSGNYSFKDLLTLLVSAPHVHPTDTEISSGYPHQPCTVCWPENWMHNLCFDVYERILTLAGATWDNHWNCVGEKEARDVGGMHLQSKWAHSSHTTTLTTVVTCYLIFSANFKLHHYFEDVSEIIFHLDVYVCDGGRTSKAPTLPTLDIARATLAMTNGSTKEQQWKHFSSNVCCQRHGMFDHEFPLKRHHLGELAILVCPPSQAETCWKKQLFNFIHLHLSHYGCCVHSRRCMQMRSDQTPKSQQFRLHRWLSTGLMTI